MQVMKPVLLMACVQQAALLILTPEDLLKISGLKTLHPGKKAQTGLPVT
jgi:hypothetical protein